MTKTAPDRVHGTVEEWFDEEGWGRLTSPDLDGLVFAHFAMLRDQPGPRDLRPGEAVVFTWVERPQDGCRYRAEDVWSDPPGAPFTPSTKGPPGAYRSELRITWDQPPTP